MNCTERGDYIDVKRIANSIVSIECRRIVVCAPLAYKRNETDRGYRFMYGFMKLTRSSDLIPGEFQN